jgi:DNA-binding CsgD family transcriptional regulator
MEVTTESIGLLLERDGELARLSFLVKQAGAGRGAVVAIEGPAGIGKTGLLLALHSLAEGQGLRGLKARGREREAGMAFAVASQLLEPPVLRGSVSERRRLLAGAARTGAGALGLAAGAAPESEFAALHGLYWLCVNLAKSVPLLLTVDDLQWADGPSLAWLGYLGGRISELPVLLAVSIREGDPAVRDPAVTCVIRDPAVHHMTLAALGPDSVATLVRRQLRNQASAAFCRACSDLTGGNPLLVTELVAAARTEQMAGSDQDAAALREIAPAAIGASVLARLARLGPDAIALAEALAVLGSQNEVSTAAEMAGLDIAAAELAADDLAAAQVLMPARPLDFFHPLIGEAVYASIRLGARRLAHRRAAALLDRAGGADRVAVHLLATGPAGDPWVVGRLSEAAADAHERGAPEVAARYLQRALAEPAPETARAELLLRLGRAEWYTGRDSAISHVQQALTQARDVTTIAGAAGTLADAFLISDRIDAAVPVLQQASSRIAVADPPRAASLEAWSVLLGIQDDRTAPGALETVDRWQAELGTMPDPPLHCLVALAQIAVRRNQAETAAPLLERILTYRPYPPPIDASACAIAALVGLEDYRALDQLCEDTLASLGQRSAVPWLVVVTGFSAWGMLHRGELADAEAQTRWALEHAGTGTLVAIDLVAHLVDVLIERDELQLAEAELTRIPSPLESHSITVLNYLMARGRLRAAQGRPAEALQDFLEAGKRCEPLGIVLAWYQWRSQAAIVHASLGRADEARTLARAEVAIARSAGLPRQLGLALRACGLVEGGPAGLELLAESVSVLERSPARTELARALADYGAALRRAGHRTQARQTLERALDLAHYCGARRIAARAREELVATGAKPRREAITGRDALTASELRVARLAAEGHTDREIAQLLFITAKTASVHLSRAYRKLGVSRRSQLAEALNSAIS